MEQPCPRCGYVSDRPARFCRQCGTPLFTESEAGQAPTRNYVPQPAPPYGNQPTPPPQYTPYEYVPSGAPDESTPETTRFYRPPVVPEYSPLVAPPQKRSRGRTILLIALLCFLFISGGITLLIVSAIRRNAHRDWSPAARIEREVRQRVEWEMARAMEEAQRQVQQAQRQQEEAQRRAEKTAPGMPVPPPAPPAPGKLPSTLEPYKYPGAQLNQAINTFGSEIIKMTTADSVDKVTEYYRKQMGNPIVQNREADGQKAIFQTSGSPSIIIMINSKDDDEDKTTISIMRTSLQLPNLNR